MTDHHVHIGQYNQTYFYPDRVVESLSLCGVSECWLSSTTSCIFCSEKHQELKDNPTAKEIAETVQSEIETATTTGKKFGIKVHPLYWVVPDFEEVGIRFEEYFSNENDTFYDGFKIHPRAQEWDLSNPATLALAERIFSFAQKNSLLILIHTGYDELDNPQKFEELIKKYPSVKVQLAHCKDTEKIEYMIQKYPNVIADNSSSQEKIPADNKRIFFGSDFPCIFFDTSNDIEYSTEDLKNEYKKMKENQKILEKNQNNC